MSKLEDIVPPLELCKRIPAGKFEKSVLVWTAHGVRSVEELSRLEFCKNLPIRKMTFPAPTLEEILDELGNKTVCLYDGIRYEVSVCMRERDIKTKEHQWRQYGEADRNPAAAALRLWLKVKGSSNVR